MESPPNARYLHNTEINVAKCRIERLGRREVPQAPRIGFQCHIESQSLIHRLEGGPAPSGPMTSLTRFCGGSGRGGADSYDSDMSLRCMCCRVTRLLSSPRSGQALRRPPPWPLGRAVPAQIPLVQCHRSLISELLSPFPSFFPPRSASGPSTTARTSYARPGRAGRPCPSASANVRQAREPGGCQGLPQ